MIICAGGFVFVSFIACISGFCVHVCFPVFHRHRNSFLGQSTGETQIHGDTFTIIMLGATRKHLLSYK